MQKPDVPPWGFCPECLERMLSGAAYEGVTLPHGRGTVFHAYCEHRQVGAELLVREGRPPRWRLQTPIDVIEWHQHVSQVLQRFELSTALLRSRKSSNVS